MHTEAMRDRTLLRIRIVLALFIAGLVVSGLTAFPLLHELELGAKILGIPPDGSPSSFTGLQYWIALVRQALRDTYQAYPFLAYGYDWLAYGHLVIALFFIPPFKDPVRYIANIHMGMIACVGVFAIAFICGPIREIPFFWRLIDCSFGALGILPLLYVHGTEDPLIPYALAKGVVDRLAGPDYEHHAYEGAMHEVLNETNKDEVIGAVTAFIDRVL